MSNENAINKVNERNRKKFGAISPLEGLMNLKNTSDQTFINSVEKALFGTYNSGQIKNFP
jgi:hypothetical protein